MKLIDRYLIKTVIAASSAVLVVMIGLQSFLQLANEMHDIGNGDYGIWQALLYVPMLMPMQVYQLLPVAALLGSLIGLGRLATGSELIVLRAAGVSKLQILMSVLKAAVCMLLIMGVLGEVLGPWLSQYAQQFKAEALSGGQALATRSGVWLRSQNQFIHIGSVLADGKVADISRMEFNPQGQLTIFSYANQGQYQHHQWVFSGVTSSHIVADHVTRQQLDQEVWALNIKPNVLGLEKVVPDEQNLIDLWDYIQYRYHNGLNAGRDQFVFWRRAIDPLTTLVMIGLAVPFIFGALRQASMGLRILAGIGMGFGFYVLNEFLGPFSLVYQIPPWVAALSPTLIFAGLGLILVSMSK